MICKKCHRFKKKSYYVRHINNCIPSKEDLKHYFDSFTNVELMIERKKKKLLKKKNGKKE